jgi:hypothetical protein
MKGRILSKWRFKASSRLFRLTGQVAGSRRNICKSNKIPPTAFLLLAAVNTKFLSHRIFLKLNDHLMRYRTACFVLCSLFLCPASHAQQIQAVVADQNTRQPIGDVFVFLANSSAGTASDEQGRFSLELPDGKEIVLVFSHLNYELFTLEIADSRYLRDTFFLRPTGIVLEEALVTSKTNSRLRNRRLKAFTKAFLGEDTNDKLVRIVNPEILLFEEKKDRLAATATEPLLIENRELGYLLHFYLEAFELHQNKDLLYRGNTFFEPLKASGEEERLFQHRRREVFKKSSRHFFSTLARGQLDSTRYQIGFSQLEHNAEFVDFTPVQPRAIIEQGKSENTYQINLRGFLTVVHLDVQLATMPQTTSPSNLRQSISKQFKAAPTEYEVSYLRSKSHKIIINKFGRIINPSDIEEYGYWTTQRVAALLPLDYVGE